METITLDYPIDFEGGKLTKIELRRPKVSDVISARKGKKDDAEAEVAMISAISALPPSAIEELDLADYKKLQEALNGFFG